MKNQIKSFVVRALPVLAALILFAPSAEAYDPPADLTTPYVSTDNEYETEYNPFAEPLTMPHWLSNLARHTCWTNYMGGFTNATISKIGFYPFWQSAGTWFIATNRHYTVNMPSNAQEYFEKLQTALWRGKDGTGSFVGNENTCLARIQKAAETKLSSGGLSTDNEVGANVTVALCQLLRPHEEGPKGHDQASDGGPHCYVASNRLQSVDNSIRPTKDASFAAGLRLDGRSWYDCDRIINFTYMKYGTNPERQKGEADAAPTVLVETFNDQYGSGIRSCIATLDKVPEDWEGTYTLHNRDYGRTEVQETVRYLAYNAESPKNPIETTTNRTRTVTHADAWPAFDEDVELDRGDVLIMKSLCYLADSAVQMLRAYRLPGNHTGLEADAAMTNLVKVQDAMHAFGYTYHSLGYSNRIDHVGYSDRIEHMIHDLYHELPTLFDKIDDSEALAAARSQYVNGLACFLDADAFITGKAKSKTGKTIVGNRNPDQLHLIEFAESEEEGGEWNFAGWREFAEKTYTSLLNKGTASAVQTLDMVDLGQKFDIHVGSRGNATDALHGVVDFSSLGPNKDGKITFDANAFFDGKITRNEVILDGSAITTNGPGYWVATRFSMPRINPQGAQPGQLYYDDKMKQYFLWPDDQPLRRLVQRLHLTLDKDKVSPTLCGFYPSGTLFSDLATMKAQYPADGAAKRTGFAKMVDIYSCERTTLNKGQSTNLVAGTTYTAAPAAGTGGAFNVIGGAALTGTNVTFASNSAGMGGSIINGGVVDLTQAMFKGNEAQELGGAIYNDNGGVLNLNDVAFENNTAIYGGAIYNASAGTVNLLGPVSLATTSDTFLNIGLMNWDLTGEPTGVLNGYENLDNDHYGQTGTLQITVDDAITAPTNIVIATGDFSNIANKDTFTITNALGGAAYGTAMIDYPFVAGPAGGTVGYKLVTEAAGETTNLVLQVVTVKPRVVVTSDNSPYEIKDCTYTAVKTSSENGGAACVEAGGTLVVSNVTFKDNFARQGSAIYIEEGGIATFADVTFSNNAGVAGEGVYNKGLVNLDGRVTVETFVVEASGDLGYFYTYGTLNWNLTDGKAGLFCNYQNLVNDCGTLLQIMVEDYEDETNTFVIATGDFLSIEKMVTDTFTITNAANGAATTAKIDGGRVFSGGSIYQLETVPDLKAEPPTTNLVFTVIQLEMVKLTDVFLIDEEGKTNATAVVKFCNQTIEPNADGSFDVPANFPLDVVYEATDDYMFGPGLKNKTFSLPNGISGNTSLDDPEYAELKAQIAAQCQAQWVDADGETGGREIALDTRERIVVADLNDIQPFAYSTNAWGAYPEANWTRIYTNATTTAPFWLSKRENGYAEWLPQTGAYGRYDFLQKWSYQIQTNPETVYGTTNATIYYSQPYSLTVNAAEGGEIAAITNGAPATGTLDVLAYEYVNLKATPESEKWEFTSWTAVTNGGVVELFWDATHPTNKFEMPLADVAVNGGFVIAKAYHAALFNAATNAYVAATNAIEQLRNNRLTNAETDGALNNALSAFNIAIGSLGLVTKPAEGDAATNTLVTALAKYESDAKSVSDAKPWTITVDANAEADGTNVFNTIDAAFAATDFLPYATNFVVIGEQKATKAMPAMTRQWDLVVSNWTSAVTYDATKSPYQQTRLVFGAAAQTAQFYSKLNIIKGEGRILVDKANPGWEQFWGTLSGKCSAADNVEVYAAEQTLTLEERQISGEQIAIDTIIVKNIDVTNETAFAVPAVSQAEGRFGWDLMEDNHQTYLANYDDVAFADSVERQIQLDTDQTEGNIVTNYVIAGSANTANGKTFYLVDANRERIDPSKYAITVGGETAYVGSKAYTLSLVENAENAGTSNLVFDIAWGKFAITYDAMGGYFADGSESNAVAAYVNQGYAFPTNTPERSDYKFLGWYRSWTNGAEQVFETNVVEQSEFYSPVLPLEDHTLWAQWESTKIDPVVAPTIFATNQVGEVAVVEGATESVGDNLIFPDMIGRAPIVEIGEKAFAPTKYTKSAIKSMATSIYTTKIGAEAFANVKTLAKVTLTEPRDYANPLKKAKLTLGRKAFANTGITELWIPEWVTNIDAYAFLNCDKLEKVYICHAVELGTQAFRRAGVSNAMEGQVSIYMPQELYNNVEFTNKLVGALLNVKPQVSTDLVAEFEAKGLLLENSTLAGKKSLKLSLGVNRITPWGALTPSSVSVGYRQTLDGTEQILQPTSVTTESDGSATATIEVPDASSGFFRIINN